MKRGAGPQVSLILLRCVDGLDKLLISIGFGHKAVSAAELLEAAVALNGIGANCPAKLGIALRAKGEGMSIGFLEMIAAAHVALVKHAMRQREHVPGFMRRDL